MQGLLLTVICAAAAGGAPAKKEQIDSNVECSVQHCMMWSLHEAYVVESEDAVLGESQPLSELLLVKFAGSSAAAAKDISRSSSGTIEIQQIHY